MRELELATLTLTTTSEIERYPVHNLIISDPKNQRLKKSNKNLHYVLVYQEKDPWISASQALFDCKVCINFDLGVPARAAWSALSAEGWSLGIGGLPVLGGRVGSGEAVVMMTPFVTWAGGSGSISGGIGRLLGTGAGGKGEGCDELGAVFAELPEGELVELDFCKRYILIVK